MATLSALSFLYMSLHARIGLPTERPVSHGVANIWSSGRWFLLLIFVLGYAITYKAFAEYAVLYFGLSVCALVGACIMIFALGQPIKKTAPFWVLYAVFILGYFVKFYWIVLFPQVMEGGSYFERLGHSTVESQIWAFKVTVYGFISFCLTASLMLILSAGEERAPSRAPAVHCRKVPRPIHSLTVGILVLISLTTYVMYTAQIAIMGIESVELPFRLAGIMFYSRTVLVPGLLLLQIWLCMENRNQAGVRFYIVFLLTFGISDMLVRSSRGAFVGLVLLLWFLVVVRGRPVGKKTIISFVAGLVLVSFLHPFIAEFRNVRIDTNDTKIVSLLSTAGQNVLGGKLSAVWDTVGAGFGASLFRLSGIDLLIVFDGLHVTPIDPGLLLHYFATGGIAAYLTSDLLGYTNVTTHASAPSFVGWFYLVGGTKVVIVGVAGFTCVIALLWRALAKAKLRTLPIAQALFLLLVLTTIVDGTLDALVSATTLSWPITVIACEMAYRRAQRRMG